jgi:phosphate starvation-inducible PhoH-like protein
MEQRIVRIGEPSVTAKIFGAADMNVKLIEDAFKVTVYNRSSGVDGEDALLVSGESEDGVGAAARAISCLARMAARSDVLGEQTVIYVINMVRDGREGELDAFDENCICLTSRGKPIKPKTIGQRQYVDAIKKNTIILGTGPAGTGKTFLAVAMAVKALRDKQVNRIILTRPAIEAGEKLGYLPGDLQSKIDPYLRPLYDALFEMMGAENYQRNLEKQIVEVAPLAYMRGRTLDDAFIILDEAQNATFEQMKMFLTRLGNNSKAVVTGDLTQTDLPRGQKSGLWSAVKILDGIEGIAIHNFTDRDVVRHKLVQKIILAYDKFERDAAKKDNERGKAKYRRPDKSKE